MAKPNNKVYLDKRRACYHCSKKLSNESTIHRGKYVASVLHIDGSDRNLHLECADMIVKGLDNVLTTIDDPSHDHIYDDLPEEI
jgi:hypothetical protein